MRRGCEMKPVVWAGVWAGVLGGCLAMPGSALAVNKCVGGDGRVSYQESPCVGRGVVIDVRPASGAAPKAADLPVAPPAGGDGAAGPARVKKEGAFGARWQRRTFLEHRGVPDAIAEVDAARRSCESKMRALESDKRYANNSLAGATYMQSLSAQMQAEAAICDTRMRELVARRQELEAELRALQADR